MCAGTSGRWKEEETMTIALQSAPLMVIMVVQLLPTKRVKMAIVSVGK
jgi:hypothetical protein